MGSLSLIEYLKSPCGASSIPYWKTKSLVIPDNMLIIHDRDFCRENYVGYDDEIYFRLYHDLKDIDVVITDNVEIVTATADIIDVLVEMINACYSDLFVTKEQLENCMKTPVYNSDLWILLKDRISGKYIGSGIADLDREVGELSIEWVQVLPEYRNRGFGGIIVNYLLNKIKGTAKFATVSGKVDNPMQPERLYRKCGFKGNDVWHILRRN